MKRVLPAMTYKLYDEYYANTGDYEIIIHDDTIEGLDNDLSREVVEYLKEEEE